MTKEAIIRRLSDFYGYKVTNDVIVQMTDSLLQAQEEALTNLVQKTFETSVFIGDPFAKKYIVNFLYHLPGEGLSAGESTDVRFGSEILALSYEELEMEVVERKVQEKRKFPLAALTGYVVVIQDIKPL